MKKRDILSLIRSHVDGDEQGFRRQCVEIAKEFELSGDREISEYIMELLSGSNAFVPQSVSPQAVYSTEGFLQPVASIDPDESRILLSEEIGHDIQGVINATRNGSGVNRFLFFGEPGTGKTEAARLVAGSLNRELFLVASSNLVDSLLGQTAKNIDALFDQINDALYPERLVVLLDEIDSIAMQRIDANDVREMGRATSAMLRGLDRLDPRVLLIATTNLYQRIDHALLRRFDLAIDFNRYDRDDLANAAYAIFERLKPTFPSIRSQKRLFRKIMELMPVIPYPGDLLNMIKTAMAFSEPGQPHDYLRRLYRSATGRDPIDVPRLSTEGFTLREIEILTGIPKSTAARRVAEYQECRG